MEHVLNPRAERAQTEGSQDLLVGQPKLLGKLQNSKRPSPEDTDGTWGMRSNVSFQPQQMYTCMHLHTNRNACTHTCTHKKIKCGDLGSVVLPGVEISWCVPILNETLSGGDPRVSTHLHSHNTRAAETRIPYRSSEAFLIVLLGFGHYVVGYNSFSRNMGKAPRLHSGIPWFSCIV